VSTWGTLEIGTHGARSSHAQIEALWLADTVPDPLALAIADHYPGLRLYRDRDLMFAAHPLTTLPPFRRPLVAGRTRITLARVLWTLASAAVCIGAPPVSAISGVPALALLWLAALIGSVLTVATGLASRSASIVAAGSSVGAWTLSAAAPLPALIIGRILLIGIVALFATTWRDARIIGADIPRRRGPEAALTRVNRWLRSRR
jgi:hypothetical protein